MKLIVSSVFLMLSLVSCASKPSPIAYDCPRIELPADPVPATRQLNPRSKPDAVIKAWVATATAYRGWNRAVRMQIENSR